MGRRRLEAGELGEITVEPVTRADNAPWFAAKTRYRDAGGVTRRLSAQGKTRAAARSALKAKHADLMKRGEASGNDAPTVASAIDAYLDGLQVQDLDTKAGGSRRVTEGTMRQYTASAVVAKSVLGTVRLSDLTVPHAQRMLESLIDPETLAGASTAKHAKGLLQRAIADAQRLGLIEGNPLQAVKLPTKGARVVKAPSSRDLEVLRDIFRWYFDTPHEGGGVRTHERVRWVTEILLATGLRIGEAMALRWKDVDMSGHRVRITGTLVENGALARQGYPKTASSAGSVALTNKAAGLLVKIYSTTEWKAPTDPVFATRTGNFTAPSAIRRSLRRLIELYPEERIQAKISPHAFRRAVATHLAETRGIEAAAKQLRHTTPTTTIAHYIERAEDVADFTAALEGL